MAAGVAASACQQPASETSSASATAIQAGNHNEAEILHVVEEWQAETRARGVLTAIATPDQTISLAVGQAVSDTGIRDIDVDDSFDTFSITKTFVAAEILLLVDEGAVDLDDSIGSHVPELLGRLDVTVRDLLSHRSGLTDHRDHPDFWAVFFRNLDREWTWDETAEFVLSQQQGPNEYFYSDSNFVILGRLIEVVTGKPLGEALADDLFGPFGLDQTAMLDGSSSSIAQIYGEFDCRRLDTLALHRETKANLQSAYCGDGSVTADELPRTAIETFDSGASGLVSSLNDLVRWAEVLFGKQVTGSVDEALPEETGQYGLGIGLRKTPFGPAYGHPGGGVFGQARMWHLPDHDVTVVAWAGETTDPDLDWLVDRMLIALLDDGDERQDNSDETLDGLRDPDPAVRAATAESFVGSETTGPEIQQALIDLVASDPESSVRASAILGLGAVARDSNSPPAIQALQSALLTDSSDEVRRNAALGLGFLGTDAIPVLRDAYGDQPRTVRDAIDMAIRRLEGDI